MISEKLIKLDENISKLKSLNEQQKKYIPKANFKGNSGYLENTAELPIELNNIEGTIEQETREGYNLLDLPNRTSTKNGVTCIVENGVITLNGTATADIEFVFNISLDSADYKLYNIDKIKITPADRIRILNNSFAEVSNIYFSEEANLKSFTNSVKRFDILISNGKTYNNYVIKPMITYANVSATKFEPYGSMPSIDYPSEVKVSNGNYEVKIGNKNLIDITNRKNDWGISAQDGMIMNIGQRYADIVKVEPNTAYTITREIGTSTYFYYGLFETEPAIGKYATKFQNMETTTLQKTIITEKNSQYLVIFYGGGTSINVQLEQGSTSTPYIPHAEETLPLDLTRLDMIKGSVYKENGKWYKKDEWGKVVLDGTNKDNFGELSDNRFFAGFAGLGVANAVDKYDGINCVCTHFKGISLGNIKTAINSVSANAANLYFRVNANTTLNDFKTFLQQHQVTVCYQLANPTTAEITDEILISQLNAIARTQLYEGGTHIEITGTEALPLIDTDYYLDIVSQAQSLSVESEVE